MNILLGLGIGLGNLNNHFGYTKSKEWCTLIKDKEELNKRLSALEKHGVNPMSIEIMSMKSNLQKISKLQFEMINRN